MEISSKIKTLRLEVIKTFFYLFVPHAVIFFGSMYMGEIENDYFSYHIIWFSIYFSISFLVFVFARKIIKMKYQRNIESDTD